MEFYSISIPSPFDIAYNNPNIMHLARIVNWNNDIMDVHWNTDTRQIIFAFDDEWIVQPDTTNIVKSLAHIFSCDEYQIRIYELNIGGDMATPEDLWTAYNRNWLYYGHNNATLEFIADIDFDADYALQWIDIAPDLQSHEPVMDEIMY
jgi:hypothetical protein